MEDDSSFYLILLFSILLCFVFQIRYWPDRIVHARDSRSVFDCPGELKLLDPFPFMEIMEIERCV